MAGLVSDHRLTLERARDRSLMASELSRQRALAFAVAGIAATEMGQLTEAHRYISRAGSTFGGRHWGFHGE